MRRRRQSMMFRADSLRTCRTVDSSYCSTPIGAASSELRVDTRTGLEASAQQ